jgi:hypothetical protein
VCPEKLSFDNAIGGASSTARCAAALAVSILIVYSLLAAPGMFAQSENSLSDDDPGPFTALLAGADTTKIPWEVSASAWGLSVHQRLAATIEIRIPGKQLASRLGKGTLLFVTQIADAQGHLYEMRDRFDLVTQKPPANADYLSVSFNAFVLPGDYKVGIAVYDSSTKEYSVEHRDLRVAGIKNDPLPESWSGLPSVEFWPPHAPLESLAAGVKFPLKTQRRVHVEILLNTTFTELAFPSKKLYDDSLADLIPEFEALSQVALTNGALDAAALDLTQQRVFFEQDDVKSLDWQRLRDSLTAGNPLVVSAASLENRKGDAQYFVGQVLQRISARGADAEPAETKTQRVMIVLSAPMAFLSGESLRPIAVAGDCECKIYYIRSHMFERAEPAADSDEQSANGPAVRQSSPTVFDPDSTGRPTQQPDACAGGICNEDQLEGTLAPLHPRVYDVYSPMDFRKALASILNDIRDR